MESELRLKIRRVYKDLRPSEKRVAEYILEGNYSPLELTIEKLAYEASASQPTVIRFARALELKGFKELKTRLIADSAIKKAYGNTGSKTNIPAGISKDDDIEDIPIKIIKMNIKQLENTLKNISRQELAKATEAIASSYRVMIAATENSCTPAEDLAVKLIFLGKTVIFYQDIYRQSMCAGSLSPNDLAIGISYSGTSKTTVKAMEEAKKAGAKTLVITNKGDTEICKYADIVLASENSDKIYGNSLFSRCSQLSIVDMLYSGTILMDFERFSNEIEKNDKIADDFSIKNG